MQNPTDMFLTMVMSQVAQVAIMGIFGENLQK